MKAPAVNGQRVIHIEPAAPPKPAVGAPCNGCGVCCLAEPCPVGMLLSMQRIGACRMLRWDDDQHRYYCGALERVQVWPAVLGHTAQYMLKRWIAAGQGCDASWTPRSDA